MIPPLPSTPLKPGLIYGVNKAWYSLPEGPTRIAEIHAHNEGILDQLFGKDAFLACDPNEEDDDLLETAFYILDSSTSQINSEPLTANPITKGESK